MKAKTKVPIPVNLIAGPLGVGKTTCINHLLTHRPNDQKWSVLVNEYGLVGLDAALMEDAAGPGSVEVKEIAGGCICCSAGIMFDVSLVLLLQRRPNRLLIEPTGLATVSGILDTLARPGISEAVDVRSVISLVDPATLHRDLERKEVRDQVEAADVLLASRSDLASESELDAFEAWCRDIYPPKRFLGRVRSGQIPLELLDLVTERCTVNTRSGQSDDADPHLWDHGATPHHHGGHDDVPDESTCDASRPILRRSHRSTVASTIGWVVWAGLVFDSTRASSWLEGLSSIPGLRRAKAVLRTNEGWRSFNWAHGAKEIRQTGHRRDSRVELVIEGDASPEAQRLERSLRSCLTST
ncbi:MAG: CobW family GTP-binding protein [Myxococcota bacterium]